MKIEDIKPGERYWVNFPGERKATPSKCLGVGKESVICRSLDTLFNAAIHPDHIVCPMQPRWWEFWKKKPTAVSDVKGEEETIRLAAQNLMPSKEVMEKLLKESPPPQIVELNHKTTNASHVRIPVGKQSDLETIDIIELRELQKTVLDGFEIRTNRERSLLDACISYVCVNANHKIAN